MSMAKIAKGLLTATVNFVVVGVALPYLLEHFSSQITAYVPLPPAGQVWAVLLAIGALFAVTGFLQSAYSKGDYPWLFGKLGSGVAVLALYLFVFSLLPSSIGSTGIQTSGLVYLVYLAIALSYGYLILDFYDARRSRPVTQKETTNMF
jgi:hypothetical protein